MARYLLALSLCLLAAACGKDDQKTVVCIPVYGQSLALGEEAQLTTDLGAMDERVVTERLDRDLGYFDPSALKQWAKRVTGYKKRTFELSVYGMAERLVTQLGSDTLLCIFPGGRGATAIADLSKGSAPYQRFVDDIRTACESASDHGWRLVVPAVCWMQGESDCVDYTDVDYQQALKRWLEDLNADVRQLTGQAEAVRLICYQTNQLTCAPRFNPEAFDCRETTVPEAQMHLLRDDTLFWASGPVYPYTFARDYIHIDGMSQKRLGHLAALSALDIMRGGRRRRGLLPTSIEARGNCVKVGLSVPSGPLYIDTLSVADPGHYGFSVITPDGRDIVASVALSADTVFIGCTEEVRGCKVRYAVNGEPMKNGRTCGPRGNLRDSQGDRLTAVIGGERYPLHNWCFQFDEPIP